MKEAISFLDNYMKLSDKAKEMILKCIDFIIVKKNTEIISIGHSNKYIYLIKKGVARGYYFRGGKEITISFWMENECFGDVTTYITKNAAIKAYQAVEDMELFRLNTSEFRALFDINHEICNLGRIIAETYIIKNEYLINCLRNLTPSEKYQLFIIIRPGLINRVKLKHIASYIGMEPETLSRIRKSNIYKGKSVNL